MTVRKARTEDAGAIADIYRGYVEETAISFEYEAPDAAAMAERMEEAIAYLVAEDDGGRIIGFAYAHPFSARAAYRRSAEVTIYLDRNETGKGIGRKLYEALGFHSLGTIAGGFRRADGSYADICPYWRETI